jgi:hypothetical protein
MSVEPTEVYKVSHEIEAKVGTLKTSYNLGGGALATKSSPKSPGWIRRKAPQDHKEYNYKVF